MRAPLPLLPFLLLSACGSSGMATPATSEDTHGLSGDIAGGAPDGSDAANLPDAEWVELPAEPDGCAPQQPLAPVPTPFAPDDVLQSPSDFNRHPDAGGCSPGEWTCFGDLSSRCDPTGSFFEPIESCGFLPCQEGRCCEPDCEGKSCGPDGCGFFCGECGAAGWCASGTCEVAGACASPDFLADRALPNLDIGQIAPLIWQDDAIVAAGVVFGSEVVLETEARPFFGSVVTLAMSAGQTVEWRTPLTDGTTFALAGGLVVLDAGSVVALTTAIRSSVLCGDACWEEYSSELAFVSQAGAIVRRTAFPPVASTDDNPTDPSGSVMDLLASPLGLHALSQSDYGKPGELLSFEADGTVLRLAGMDRPSQLAASPDGKLVVLAETDGSWTLTAYATDGTPDWSVPSPVNGYSGAGLDGTTGGVFLIAQEFHDGHRADGLALFRVSAAGVEELSRTAAGMTGLPWTRLTLPNGRHGLTDGTGLIRIGSDGAVALGAPSCSAGHSYAAARLRADGHVEHTDGQTIWVSGTSFAAPDCE